MAEHAEPFIFSDIAYKKIQDSQPTVFIDTVDFLV